MFEISSKCVTSGVDLKKGLSAIFFRSNVHSIIENPRASAITQPSRTFLGNIEFYHPPLDSAYLA